MECNPIGDNPGCGTNGFSARAGWDPVRHWFFPSFASELILDSASIDHWIWHTQLFEAADRSGSLNFELAVSWIFGGCGLLLCLDLSGNYIGILDLRS